MSKTQLVAWIAGLAVLIGLVAVVPLTSSSLGGRDFLPYWSASHLLVTGGNPYALAQLDRLNQVVAPERGAVEPAWNPPWLMVVLVPLGLLPYQSAARIWLMINTLLHGFLPFLIWRWLAGPVRRPPAWVLMLGLAFAGSLVQIAIGQITIVILLGYVLCLAALRTERDFLAGVALVLTLNKPQLSYLVLPLILLWAARQRRWRVWLGLIVAAAIGLLLITLLLPDWLHSYLAALGSNDFFAAKFTATLNGFAKATFHTDALRYIGAAALLLIPWLLKLIERRDLLTGVNVALLISLPLSPYGWSFDQILLLPAITQLAFWIARTREADRRTRYALALILIDAAMLGMKLAGVGDFFFVWVPIALGGLYAVLYRSYYQAIRLPNSAAGAGLPKSAA